MKKFVMILFIPFLLVGCGQKMMNTPTKKVEMFFANYQSLDDSVVKQLNDVANEEELFNSTQRKEYVDLMKKHYQDLKYEIKDEISLKELLVLYRKCLEIISELHNKGIGYLDIHGRNFLVNDKLDVKLIDFEPDLVKFEDSHALKVSLNNFYCMINLINERINLNASYIKPASIEEAKIGRASCRERV